MKIRRVTLQRLRLPLRVPFVTSYGANAHKYCLLVTVDTANAQGYGECSAFAAPLYLEETTGTAWHVLRDFFIPALFRAPLSGPLDVRDILRPFRGHPMAKAALEAAVWDAFAKERGESLAKALGAADAPDVPEIAVGVSLGLQADEDALNSLIEDSLRAGYRRIKIKIAPGRDSGVVRAVRAAHGAIELAVDANAAYRLSDAGALRTLDEHHLVMIEQPLAPDDLVDHAALQAQLKTPLCLDESVKSSDDGRKAAQIGACRIVNIKAARVGGLAEARDLQAVCASFGLDAWCGGMLETGVGRLANLALAALPGFTMPADLAQSDHYFAEDIIEPAVQFARPGFIAVPRGPGIGAEVRTALVARLAQETQVFLPD